MSDPFPRDLGRAPVNARSPRGRRLDRQELRPEDPPTEPAGTDDFPDRPPSSEVNQ